MIEKVRCSVCLARQAAVYYWILNNNGKENKEGRNLRKVRLQIRCFTQESRQKVRNYPESQICESIQWKGKSTTLNLASNAGTSRSLNISSKLACSLMCRIASRDLLSASGNASPQTKRLQVEHTNFQQPQLWLPRQRSTVCVDSGNKAPTNEQPNEINRRCMLIENSLHHDRIGGKRRSLNRPNRLRQTKRPAPGTFFLKHKEHWTVISCRQIAANWRGVKNLLTTEVCPQSYLLLPFCKEVSLYFVFLLLSSTFLFYIIYSVQMASPKLHSLSLSFNPLF